MLIKHRSFEPVVDSSVFVAPNAVLVGKVRVGPKSRIMYGAVLDSEGSSVEIGESTIICENVVIRATRHGEADHAVSCGNHVFIGPHATLLGCTVEPFTYIATGATILQGAVVRSGAIIAVGALVHVRTVVPPDFFVPPNTIAVGDPAQIFSPDEKASLVEAIKSLNFPKIAFGLDIPRRDRSSVMKNITEVRSKEFEGHLSDDIL